MKKLVQSFASLCVLSFLAFTQAQNLPTRVTVTATDPTAAEGASSGLFTFTRSGPTNTAIQVLYHVSGTAAPGLDYDAFSGSITIPAGRPRATLQVEVAGDDVAEDTETVVVTLAPSTAYELGDSRTATVRIVDNDLGFVPLPTVTIVAKDQAGAEERNGPATFELTRLGSTTGELKVDLIFATTPYAQSNVLGGPVRMIPAAVHGTDYAQIATNAVFGAGRRTVTIQIVPKDDSLREGWEHVTLSVRRTSTYNVNALQDSATVFIEDNDDAAAVQPTISVAAMPPEIQEAQEQGGAFVFTRTGNMDHPLHVLFRITGSANNGIDYHTITNWILFPARTEVVRIAIRPVPDKALEGRETIVITLSTSDCLTTIPPSLNCYKIGGNGRATMSILETPPNVAPTVKVTTPADGARFATGVNIPMRAEATDSDGTIERLDLYVGDKLWTSVKRSPLESTLSNYPAGEYVLRAVALDNSGAASTSAPVRIVITAPVNTFAARINFQPAGTRIPEGFTTDNGLVFGPREGGLTFGWKVDNREQMVNRNAPNSPDQEHDTFAIMEWGTTKNIWEIKVANGSYRVHIVAGDPRSTNGVYDIQAEGIRVVSGRPTANSFWLEGTKTVQVNDGLLTVSSGPDARTNKICFIEISAESNTANKPPVVTILTPAKGAAFNVGSSIAIAATASDPDGVVRTVEFLEGSRVLGVSTNTAAGVDTFRISWPNVPAGTYTLRARATDNAGGSTLSEPVTITVGPVAVLEPKVQIREPLDGAKVKVGELKFNILAVDSQGYIIEGMLYRGDALVADEKRTYIVAPRPGTPAEFTFVITNSQPGTYTFLAQARNDRGIVNGSQPIQVTVTNAANQVFPPSVSISSPLDGSRGVAGSNVVVLVNAQGKEGATIAQVQVLLDGRALGVATNNAANVYRYDWRQVPFGTYKLTAVARDSRGLISTSAPVSINITEFDGQNQVSIRAEPSEINEGGSGVFRLIRTGSQDFDLPVFLSISGTAQNGVDYARLTNTVIIPARTNAVDVRLSALADNITEGKETVIVKVESPACIAIFPPPRTCYTVSATNQALITINDANLPALPVISVEASDKEASEPLLGTTVINTGTLRFTRQGPTNAAISVALKIGGNAINGVDYQTVADSVTIAAGSRTAELTVRPFLDTMQEGPESVDISILPGVGYSVGAPSAAAITIADTTPATPNNPPRVFITSPTNNFQTFGPTNLVLAAEASDTDGTVAKVEFLVGNSSVGVDTTAPYSVIWTNREPGTYAIAARATDNRGTNTLSTSVVITVRPRTAGALAAGVETQILSIEPGTGGEVQITFAGSAGRTYEVQASPDLMNWEVIRRISFTSSTASITDVATTHQKYYRLQLLE